MTEESLRQAASLARHSDALRDLLVEARAAATRAAGADRTGAVRIFVGPDGLPESIWVDPGWRSMLEPADFGTAVLDACRTASQTMTADWLRGLDDEDWRYGLDRAQDDRTGGEPAARPTPESLRRSARRAAPRPIEQIVDEVLEACESLDELAAGPAPPERTGIGADNSGQLTVTVTPAGLSSCTVRPEWADWQRGSTLMDAFGQALAAARVDLAAAAVRADVAAGAGGARADLAAVGTQFQSLFQEALANLHLSPRIDEP